MILKDICKINSGKSIKACLICDKDINHNIPCFGGNGLRGFVSSPNQVGGNPIIGRVGAQCGNIHYCDEPFYATEHALVVTLKDDNVNPQWLCRKFESMKLGTYAEGAAQPVIAASKLLQLEIAIPPLSEQQSIVDYLDSAFAKIDAMKANAEKALNEAKALFQASLKEMLEPKEGWEEKTLGELCEIYGRIGFRGYTTKDLVSSAKDGAISLSPSNIQDGKMDYSKCTYISWFKYEESPEIKIFNGDILLVKTGSSYGKSAIVENLPHEATLNPQSVVLKDIKIDNNFFAYQLRTNRVRRVFDQFVSGTAIPTFSQAKLSTVHILYPPLSEQQSIVATLDSLKSKVDRLQANYDKISQECGALKQAILRQVFE